MEPYNLSMWRGFTHVLAVLNGIGTVIRNREVRHACIATEVYEGSKY